MAESEQSEPTPDNESASAEPAAPEPPRGEKPSWRHPFKGIYWWLTKKPPSILDTAFITVAATYGTVLLAAIAAAVLAALTGEVKIPVWVLPAVSGGTLLAGMGVGVVLSRTQYGPQLRAADATAAGATQARDAAQQEARVAKELAAAERELRLRLEPESLALQRFGIYTDYVFRLLDEIRREPAQFRDPTALSVGKAFCELPGETMSEAVGVPVQLSLWFEGNPKEKRELLPIESARERVRNFWIPCAPEHSDPERRDFRVPVQKSWIAWSRGFQEGDPEESERIFKLDPISVAHVRGRDIEVFRKHNYESVRAAAFDCSGRPGYVVALSRSSLTLSQAEDRFVGLLAAAMTMAGDLLATAERD